MWMIQPEGASELTLYFNEFNTEEGYDLLQVYEMPTQELLADLSGDITPDPVTSPTGKAYVAFSTNNAITAPGWEIYYETDLVKVKENLLEENLKIYPNPGRELITLEGDLAELAAFSLYNAIGKNVSSLIRIVEKNNISLKVDISRLPNGVYTIKAQNHTVKFIKH